MKYLSSFYLTLVLNQLKLEGRKGMNFKTQEIINWFFNFENREVRLVGTTQSFYIPIQINQLPHLLGLQYLNENRIEFRGVGLINKVLSENLSDEEIITTIHKNHGIVYRKFFEDRLNTFQTFMENIDQAKIVEMTDTKTKIKSQYLVVDDIIHNKIKQLGIVHTSNMDYLYNYHIDILETYFVRKDNKYYKCTTVNEPITQVLVFDNDRNIWRAGSFNLKKDEVLKDIKLSMQEPQYQGVLDEVKQEVESFEYEGFHFIGLRSFTQEEKDYDLKEVSVFIDSDGMRKLKHYTYESFIQNDEQADLFLNLETGNVYVPGNHQLFKWKISPEEVAECLQTKLEEVNSMNMDEVTRGYKMNL